MQDRLKWLVLFAMKSLCLMTLAAAPLAAQQVPDVGSGLPSAEEGWQSSVEWHGFGNWYYAKTDGNSYLGGNESGEYGNLEAGVIVSAEPLERLEVKTQLSGEQIGGGESEFVVEYAFAEWRFSDQLRLRVGKAKHPFGIYTEVFDIGTARPFLSLPQAFYGPIGLANEAYLGLGLTGRRDFANGWSSSFDLYGGGLDLTLRAELDPDGDSESGLESLRDVLGGRVAFSPPASGLSFGASAYTGSEVHTERRHLNFALHGEYLTDRLWLRGEVGHHDEREEQTADSGYVEAAWFLSEDWQVAARYDHVRTDLEEPLTREQRDSIQHRDLAFGLNRWFSRNLVLKLSVHNVTGNRLTEPEEAESEPGDPAAVDRKTRYVAFGAQFTF